MSDYTCLADGLIVPADFDVTQVNCNEIVVGPTGCGKSFSNAYSRLLHTFESSVIVPLAKKSLYYKFEKMFKQRGYKTICIDYSNPIESSVGYDPLDYICDDIDVVNLARTVLGLDDKNKPTNVDPYWAESAASVLAAEIFATIYHAEEKNEKPSFFDVVEFHRKLRVNYSGSNSSTSADDIFEYLGEIKPGNMATELWKTVQGLAPRTASCIFSTVNNSLDKIFSQSVKDMITRDNRIDFSTVGDEKTAMFIITSPMNKTLNNLVNIMYADMFRVLFEKAEASLEARLKVPVHIICDDFACGARIADFEERISIFRAAGISVTLLIQSESQLTAMYGEEAATTIINNCDTYVYMGGMDIQTCKNVSQRLDKSFTSVMSMPLGQVAVFRRGSKPFIAKRYQTKEDPIYKEVFENDR